MTDEEKEQVVKKALIFGYVGRIPPRRDVEVKVIEADNVDFNCNFFPKEVIGNLVWNPNIKTVIS